MRGCLRGPRLLVDYGIRIARNGIPHGCLAWGRLFLWRDSWRLLFALFRSETGIKCTEA